MRPVHFHECNPLTVPLSFFIFTTGYPWATLVFSSTGSLVTMLVRATYLVIGTGDTGKNLIWSISGRPLAGYESPCPSSPVLLCLALESVCITGMLKSLASLSVLRA